MSKKIKPTGRQKGIFLAHLVVYAIATFLMWTMYDKNIVGWAYPWPAWITAAWGLAIIGHWCALYTNYEDKGLDEFNRQVQNG
ncbi:MAG: 2TM domain-containing protein [Bacteroidota bacterium]